MFTVTRSIDPTLIRFLEPRDASLVLDHLQRLGTECRRSRFGNEVSDGFLRDYVNRIDHSNTDVAAYLEDARVIGIAELRSLTATWHLGAEVAFSVDAPFRGRGIGSALMTFVLEQARARRLDRVFLICDQRNRPMQRVAEKSYAVMEFMDGDCHAEIPVPLRQRAAA